MTVELAYIITTVSQATNLLYFCSFCYRSFLQGDMVTWFLWTPDIPSPMVVTMIHSRPNFPSVQHTAAYSFAPAIG